jgi:hypothetical protein
MEPDKKSIMNWSFPLKWQFLLSMDTLCRFKPANAIGANSRSSDGSETDASIEQCSNARSAILKSFEQVPNETVTSESQE